MKLNLKIPAFYKNRYGIDKEVDTMCKEIIFLVSDKNYSPKVDIIDFIPVIIPKVLISQGKGKEFTKLDLSYNLVAMSRQLDFKEYQNADISKKQKMILSCLFNSLKEIKDKINFDINQFKQDIEEYLSINID